MEKQTIGRIVSKEIWAKCDKPISNRWNVGKEKGKTS